MTRETPAPAYVLQHPLGSPRFYSRLPERCQRSLLETPALRAPSQAATHCSSVQIGPWLPETLGFVLIRRGRAKATRAIWGACGPKTNWSNRLTIASL